MLLERIRSRSWPAGAFSSLTHGATDRKVCTDKDCTQARRLATGFRVCRSGRLNEGSASAQSGRRPGLAGLRQHRSRGCWCRNARQPKSAGSVPGRVHVVGARRVRQQRTGLAGRSGQGRQAAPTRPRHHRQCLCQRCGRPHLEFVQQDAAGKPGEGAALRLFRVSTDTVAHAIRLDAYALSTRRNAWERLRGRLRFRRLCRLTWCTRRVVRLIRPTMAIASKGACAPRTVTWAPPAIGVASSPAPCGCLPMDCRCRTKFSTPAA